MLSAVNRARLCRFAAVSLAVVCAAVVPWQAAAVTLTSTDEQEAFLKWTAEQAKQVGSATRVSGRVGGVFDLRVTSTDRSYNYKLRATWLTPEVIRAAARLAQLSESLSDEQTQALVREAEAVGDAVVLVEVDPREGSGVIPLDWIARLQPKGVSPGEPGAVRGTNTPRLRELRALAGVFRRDYAYDVFWIVFPLTTGAGTAVFSETTREAELVVQIHDKQGRVTWPVPAYVRSLAGHAKQP
jgi:hypothetical protein